MVSKRTAAAAEQPFKPTRQQLIEAAGKTVPDVIAPGLRVLFCGINPGLYTAAVGHHFARPGNRFWPALHASGFTARLLSPFEERELLERGCGITNVVPRATAARDASGVPEELGQAVDDRVDVVAKRRDAGVVRVELADEARRRGGVREE